jgi:hypothetical protein
MPALPAARRTTFSGAAWLSIAAAAGAAAVIAFTLLRPDMPPAPTERPTAPVETPSVSDPPPAQRSESAPPEQGSGPAPAGAERPGAADARAATATLQPRALRLELLALKPVWIRVTVDGQRTIEREVPAEFRVTLDADRAIAIRAGNAGALMVGENNAAPAPLGREGQVVTRIFPSPSGR